MYTAYMIFAIVLVVSFLTGNNVLLAEHRLKSKRLVLEKGRLVDGEVL